MNVNSLAFNCYRCGSRSSPELTLAAFLENPVIPSLRQATAAGATAGRVARNELPPLTEALVDRYARFLLDSPSTMSDLERRRGWSEETVRRLRIGYDGAYLWIPVFDLGGKLVNARLYDPFKRARVKSLHYANGTGLTRTSVWVPFGPESLAGHSSVWMFEGEADCILAAQLGFPAAVITGGAGTWCDELPSVLGTRRCVFCYDMDAAGRRGARSHTARLRNLGFDVLDLEFELSAPAELNDFTDAILKDRRDAAWFKALARAGWGDGAPPNATPPMKVPLGGGVPGDRITVKAHVAGTHTVPLIVPQSVHARCRVDWQPDRACRGCPVGRAAGNRRIDIEPESLELMTLAATGVLRQEPEFRRLTGAPDRCPNVTFETPVMWQVQPIKLVPTMTDRAGGDSTMRAAFAVAPADGRPPPVKANQLYDFDGRIRPDVRTNEWTLVSSDSSPAEDDVDAFRLSADLASGLADAFRPSSWDLASMSTAFEAEEDRMARHVTKVYGRRLLLRAVDLVYHSPLKFTFRGSTPARGWLSLGGVGHTRTGKSETMHSYSRYVGFGRMVMDPANTTYAGLVGGLQQMGQSDKSWAITWGLIPTNDRGLVIVDEASSLSTDDIGKMSGMRSSGVAELTKIRNASTPARTRLIIFGNPRNPNISSMTEAFSDLIGAPEDIARFDFAMGVRGGFDKEAADRALGEQPFPIDLALRRDLIRFAWSRRNEQIAFEPGAEDLCVSLADGMVRDYDAAVPLVESSEQDLRIARVAVAAAIRTFSTMSDDPNIVLVRRCHVEFAHATMRAMYDGDLGYDTFSRLKSRTRLDRAAAMKLVMAHQRDVARTCRALMSIRKVSVNSIGMALALDANEARVMISQFAGIGAAEFAKDSSAMHWTAEFADFLHSTELDPPKQSAASEAF